MVRTGEGGLSGWSSAFLAVAVCFYSGCAAIRITDPPATATQQFMTSEAVVRSIEQLSFASLRGRRVYVDYSYLIDAEKRFATAEFRAGLLEAGAYVQEKRDDAEMIVEVRSGGVGIDRYESLVGVPSITGPAAGAGAVSAAMPAIVTPEIAISKNLRQVGYASFAYVAYWADSGELAASSGPYIGKTLREDWWFLGLGPRTVGNVPVVNRTVD